MNITAYTDGACKGNPGRGGWAYIIFFNKYKWVVSGRKVQTTNNEMELTAVLNCLLHIPEGSIATIKSDSEYVLKGIVKNLPGTITCEDEINGWMRLWKTNNWVKKVGPIKNLELWKQIYDRIVEIVNQKGVLTFEWVKGHNGDPGNEEVDRIASDEADTILSLKN